MLRKIYNLLLLAFLFLLPWQTRFIWHYGELNGGYWEYGTFSIYATEILLWIILILFFIQHFLRKEFWIELKEKPPRIFLILLLLFLALSAVLSENFWVSYNFVFRILEAMAFFVILSKAKDPLNQNERDSSVASPPQNDRLKLALWAGAAAQGALAVWQFLTQNIWASKWLGMAGQEAGNLGPSVIEFADQRWLRAYGGFGSPHSLGIYLAVLFVLGLVLYLKTELPKIKIAISVGQIFVLSGLLVSYSRGAWLAATVGVFSLFVVLIYNRKLSFPPKSGNPDNLLDTGFPIKLGMTTLKDFIKQLSFALAVIIFWLVIFYPVFTARFNFDNRLEARSINERKGQYAEALSFIKSNPVLGVGPGAYTYALYKKYSDLPVWQYQPIHNIYLMMIVELGIPLAFMLLSFIIYLFIKIYKTNPLFFPVVATLLLAGIFDHWLWSMYAGLMFWYVVFGLAKEAK